MNPNTTTNTRPSLAVLTESTTNPRRIYDNAALKELAESIRVQGVLSPLLVRPLNERGFEIVAGARRYRAAQMAEAETVPVRIVNLTDAEALEAQLVENLIRADVHPMEEANGFRALLNLEEPKYSIEQNLRPDRKDTRVRGLTFEIDRAFARCGRCVLPRGDRHRTRAVTGEATTRATGRGAQCLLSGAVRTNNKTKRTLLPVRNLQQWIEHNILLELASAPFSKTDAQLVPEAGSCVDCPKRTGHNKLLFADMVTGQKDSCSDPKCYAVKLDAHIRQTIAAKPKLVQISTGYGQQKEGSTTLPRNKYVEVRQEKPKTKEEATRPEFKTCKYTTEAIVSEGIERGETRTVCAQADCPVHHPKKQTSTHEPKWNVEEQKRRREEALARQRDSAHLPPSSQPFQCD